MFKTLQNIETSFKMMRMVTIITVLGSLSFACYVKCSSDALIERERHKVYVLDNGKSLMLALSQDMAQNRPAEARHHIKMFHELFFSLSPDNDAIQHNVQRALYLADRSAYQYFNDLKEAGYYRRLIANNIMQQIRVDSVHCSMEAYPYRAQTFARQTIIRGSNITHRTLSSVCFLENTVRSDNNPHGFLITRFLITDNKELSQEKR